jgi:hypothetical protein
MHYFCDPLDSRDEGPAHGSMTQTYFLLHVIEGVRGVNGEAYEDDVRIRVAQRAKSIIVFLTCGIPQSQLDVLPVDFDIGNIILKNGRDVNLSFIVKSRRAKLQEDSHVGEYSLGKYDQEAGLHEEP